MSKVFPDELPGYLRQLIMHFGSGRDAYFIVAMAVTVLEFSLLFVVDFPYIVCDYISGNFNLQEEKFFTEESSSCNVYNCWLRLQYYNIYDMRIIFSCVRHQSV